MRWPMASVVIVAALAVVVSGAAPVDGVPPRPDSDGEGMSGEAALGQLRGRGPIDSQPLWLDASKRGLAEQTGGSGKAKVEYLPQVEISDYTFMFSLVQVQGAHPRDAVEQQVRGSRAEIQRCLSQQSGRRPAVSGRLVIQFVIGPTGAVSSVSTSSSPLVDTTARQCITRAVQRLSFPRPAAGGTTTVRLPVELRPPSPRG